MFGDIVTEFENVTKFGLLKYMEDYRDFMQRDFAYLSAYYAGKTEEVSSEVTEHYNSLTARSKTLLQNFKNFRSKLSNCGFWELQQYCQNLNDVLERVGKLPKYYRTVKSVRGYQPFVKVKADIGGLKTPQDLAMEIGSAGVTETSLILDNDLQESAWEIDRLSQIDATINNRNDLVVETILEPAVGEQIYGKDIHKKITIVDNDLDGSSDLDNVEQKVDTLLLLNKGDVPEMPAFGKNNILGLNSGSYNYAEMMKDIRNTFLQDDLFDSVEITDMSFKNGDLNVTCNIKTKYSYSTTKTFTL